MLQYKIPLCLCNQAGSIDLNGLLSQRMSHVASIGMYLKDSHIQYFYSESGRQDWRTIKSVGSTTRVISRGSLLIRRRSIVAAVRPNSRRGACTVVKGGFMISV